MFYGLSVASAVCHPAGQYGQSTRLFPQKTSGDLLGRLIFQLAPRLSMTQLFPCLVPTCPDGSGAFCSGAGRCAARLHQWGYTDNPLCVCGATQTMSHIVDSCPVYKFEGGLASLHTTSDSAVKWLRHSCIR